MHLVLVDDDEVIRETTQIALERLGYTVTGFEDGRDGYEFIASQGADVVLLDLMLPTMNGASITRAIRERSNVPIIVISARSEPIDIVQALEAGADDYLPKPFALEELLARVGSLLRRTRSETRKAAGKDQTRLQFEDLVMDTSTRDVTRGGRAISLTRTEFALLHLLLQNPRHVLARQTILEEVWGYDFPTSGNALEVYIGYLRRKTEAGGESRLIHTVRGVGYVLRETAP